MDRRRTYSRRCWPSRWSVWPGSPPRWAGAHSSGGATQPDATPTATATPSPTPTATPTRTATPASTPTPSAEERRQRDLDRFRGRFENALSRTDDDEDLHPITVLETAYRDTQDGGTELFVVWRACDDPALHRFQHVTLTELYAVATADFEGALPDRLRSYAVGDLQGVPDLVTVVTTTESRASESDELDPEEHIQRWEERIQVATDAKDRASPLALEQSTTEAANEAVREEHDEPGGWCGQAHTPPLQP
jgi:hypothetical protein